jgi:hypothetical protein
MGYDTEESVVSELTLFVDNGRDLYERHAVPIFTNLVTKMARGVYDHARAVQAFSYLAEAGAKKYAREHGGGEREWHLIFPIAVRRKAAEAWAKSFEGEAELGNYDRLLPKKYQKPAPAPASSRTKHSRAYTDGGGARAHRGHEPRMDTDQVPQVREVTRLRARVPHPDAGGARRHARKLSRPAKGSIDVH